ncbi:capsular biosynthesis protein [Caldimonas sp. KR1-144]|uniref:capsular biosynthesis protein n=1 Tax=Caldimonas sp. KR1-144 TaxID=3400911 RepID=UPI003BFE3821
MNQLKALTPRRLKIALLAIPVALGIVYYGLIASARYVSEATVALQRAGNDGSAIPGAALLLAGINPQSREDTLYLKQYIHSLALLTKLEERLQLRKHFSQRRLDLAVHLSPEANQEEFLEYYRQRVDVVLDDLSSTLTVRVQGFDADFAHRVNQAILEESERFVNELSHKLAREKLSFAEGELKLAGERLQQAKEDVLKFQAKNRFLDPTIQARASGYVTAELQTQITKSEAELGGLRAFLNEDAYQVRALKAQIAALRSQLESERERATASGKKGDRLGELAVDFKALELQAEFALDAYKLSLAAVENARIEATRKLKTLSVIEPPTLPQSAAYPRRLYNLATLTVACLLLYAVARLILATIREHQD